MAEKYSSLKVTISPIGEKRYLSLLDSDLPGVGGGRGAEFTFDPEAPSGGAPKLASFLGMLTTGAISSRVLETFGKCLFDCAFAGANGPKYQQAIVLAEHFERRLRICMNVLAPDLIQVPWEFMHDGAGFVVKRGPAIVRLLEGTSSEGSSFAPLRSLLVAMADPTSQPDDYVPFGGEAHVNALLPILRDIRGLNVTPLLHVKCDDLLQVFRKNEFDAFYFIGHGVYLKDGGGHLMCENNGVAEALSADDLASAIRESNNLRFVYLNSCSTAVTSSQNHMQGVGQRLMRDGRVSAVAAMQADVKQQAAQRMALSFFENLADGRSPEDAMLLSRINAGDLQTFGIPVLYSTLDAPKEFERNRIAAFFHSSSKSSCVHLLPQFILGLRGKAGEDANRKGLKGKQPYYRGATFATADVNAALPLMKLLSHVVPEERIRLASNMEVDLGKVGESHWFIFGSESSNVLKGVLERSKPSFEFEWAPPNQRGYWLIRDLENENCYRVRTPTDLDIEAFNAQTDYGVVQKIVDPANDRVYFLIAGLGSRATQGCGKYLAERWEDLLHEFGQEEFGIVLRFPGNLGLTAEREPRKPGANPCVEPAGAPKASKKRSRR